MEFFRLNMESMDVSDLRPRTKTRSKGLLCLLFVFIVLVGNSLALALVHILVLPYFHKQAYESPNADGLVWVFGGDEANSVEVLDVTTQDACKIPSNLPWDEPTFGAFGFFDGRHPVICSGRNGNQCLHWDGSIWSDYFPNPAGLDQIIPEYSAIAQHGLDTLWITGGKSVDSAAAIKNTRFLHQKFGFAPGPDLPDARYGHCLVPLIPGHQYLLVGGMPFTRSVYLFVEGHWYPQQSLEEARHGPACAKVFHPNGVTTLVVVAGGYNQYGSSSSVDIFSMERLVWTKGVALPFAIHFGGSVPWRNTFLILGGNGANGTKLTGVVTYDPKVGNWNVLPVKLSQGRVYFPALVIPTSESIGC